MKKTVSNKIIKGLVILTLVFAGQVFALENPVEQRVSIHGVVLDRSTRLPVGMANVVVVGLNRGAAADLDGKFVITNLASGTYHITASALGYEPVTISEILVTPSRSREVEFLLQAGAIKTDEVTVTAKLFSSATPELPTSSRSLSYEEIRRAPGAAEDVQRMVQSLPGVVNTDDSDNEIVVRGGSPLENLTVIDGIEVNNTNHLTFGDESEGNGGPINALNTEFLRNVTFASGGFSAKYGDRLSSVLDLNLREGSWERFGGAANLSMVGIGGYLEGPLSKGRGSYLASIHKSYLDFLPKDAVGLSSVPQYWNAQSKIAFDLSAKHRLTINGLYIEDSHSFSPEDKENEEKNDDEATLSEETDALDFNTLKYMYGARLRSLWGPGYTDLVVARSVAYAHWDIREEVGDIVEKRLKRTTLNRRTDITDQIHLHWTGKGFSRDEWGAGISFKPVTYKHELWVDGDSIAFDDGHINRDNSDQPIFDGEPDLFYFSDVDEDAEETSLKYASYLQYTWRPLRTLMVTGGIRHDGFDYSGKDVIGPRMSMIWDFTPGWTLNLAWGTYHQSQLLSVYMDDTAKGANRYLPYSRTYQYIAGLTFVPWSSSLVSVEGYYKDYDKLIISEEDIVRETTGDHRFDSDVMQAKQSKEALGFEFFAQQRLAGNWYGTLSYSYGESESTDPAYGTYPSSYDFRNVVTAVLGYKTSFISNPGYLNTIRKPWFWWIYIIPVNGDEVTFSTKFRYITGRPYTRQIWYPEDYETADHIYEGHWVEEGCNNERYPDYSRWDIRIDNKHYFGHSALVLYLEAENMLNRKNIAQYYYDDNDGNIKKVYQFRQMFILGIRYEF